MLQIAARSLDTVLPFELEDRTTRTCGVLEHVVHPARLYRAQRAGPEGCVMEEDFGLDTQGYLVGCAPDSVRQDRFRVMDCRVSVCPSRTPPSSTIG